MEDKIVLQIDGQPHAVPAGCSVAVALAHAGLIATRRSVSGQPRAAFCGMGQCQECQVTIDGVANRLACMSPATAGMVIATT